MLDNTTVVAVPSGSDWGSLVQRVMVAFEVMSGFMPLDDKVQVVMQNGRQALREMGGALCPASEGEGFHHENNVSEQRPAAGGGCRGGVGGHQG